MSHATGNFSPNASDTGCCATEDMKHKANELKQNVHDLGNTARMAAQEQMHNIKQAAGHYVDQGREQLDALKGSAAECLEQGRARAMQMERTIEGQIRSQPMRAMLIAAGIGLVAGFLLARR